MPEDLKRKKFDQSWIGKLPEAARSFASRRRLDEVECIVPDMAGIARGKAMPASKFARTGALHLPISIFYQTITGDWVRKAGEGWLTEPDTTLVPDYGTATAVPWTADHTLQIIHDVFDKEGAPVPIAPRNVLKRVVELYRRRGWQPIVAPEMEFYLVAPNLDPAKPVEPPMGRTGRRAAARQAYSMSAVDEYGPVIDDIYDFAEEMGFEIDAITQEGGAGQVEINLQHGDPVALADEIFYFKRIIREAALRHDIYATFMAKPMQDEPGSAMHIHHSVIDLETGRNIFSTEEGGESEAFFHFIAGLQNHLASVTAILAPYVNSYRRYVPDFAAPINLEWGRDNRTTGIRVPVATPEARRVENRLAGMDANPYLAIAASLACGLLGLIEKKAPREEMTGGSYIAEDIPKGLGEALELFEEAGAIRELLGETFCRTYERVKRNEHSEFLQVISPWEREHLLLNV